MEGVKSVNPDVTNDDFIFNYSFLDQNIQAQYDSEQRSAKLFNLFALISIFISILGLFGLSSYISELRFKEVGVRKVFGADIINVTMLMMKRFLIWIVIADIIALPLAWFVMNKWLNNFAYRIDISLLNFIYATIIALAIAVITISYKTMKVASSNPIIALKYE